MDENSAKRVLSNSKDRISQLPEFILQHILCFVSQEEAVRTCVLSTRWRDVGCTRPEMKFDEGDYKGRRETFISALHKTLQGYRDRNMSIKEFDVEMSVADSDSFSLLENWIPIVLLNMLVEKFRLCLIADKPTYALPSAFLEAKSLQELHLQNCKFDERAPDKVHCKNLKRFLLRKVRINEDIFQKIITSCPLIESISLSRCKRLRTIILNEKLPHLKHFSYCNAGGKNTEIHLPNTLETIDVTCTLIDIESIGITGNVNWFHGIKFPMLKSLSLVFVQLSNTLLENFSGNFPVLESITIEYCGGFKELRLSSDSIKNFTISFEQKKSFSIVAPKVLKSEISSQFLFSISISTTSTKWKATICLDLPDDDHDLQIWFANLQSMLKVLNGFETTLNVHLVYHGNQLIKDPPVELLRCDSGSGGLYKPLVVENLKLSNCRLPSVAASFLNSFFRICRPRNITELEWVENEIVEFLCKILLCRNDHGLQYFWQHDLEEVWVEEFDENEKVWYPICGTSSLEYSCPNNKDLQSRFRLKWRDASYLQI